MYHVTIKPLTLGQRFKKFAMSYTGIMTWISAVALIWAFLYKYLFVNIPARWECMPVLGEIFFAVVLSVVASTIVLIVTIYIPERQKQHKADAIVMPWLKQYVLLGETILKDIAGKTDVTHEEFKEKCTYDFKSPIYSLLLDEPFERHPNWFSYFDSVFAEQEICYSRLIPYMNMLPLEVVEDIELLLMPDELRNAISTYRNMYDVEGVDENFKKLTNLERIIWRDAVIMKGLADKYQKLA